MRRREFISVMGGAAATWTFAARAQQKIPQIGYMGNSTAALEANLTNAFREGMRDAGYEEGRNIAIKYLWADGQYDRPSDVLHVALFCRIFAVAHEKPEP